MQREGAKTPSECGSSQVSFELWELKDRIRPSKAQLLSFACQANHNLMEAQALKREFGHAHVECHHDRHTDREERLVCSME